MACVSGILRASSAVFLLHEQLGWIGLTTNGVTHIYPTRPHSTSAPAKTELVKT